MRRLSFIAAFLAAVMLVSAAYSPIEVSGTTMSLGTGLTLQFTQNSETFSILGGSANPSAGGGVAAPAGSIYTQDAAGGDGGTLWIKTADADTGWGAVSPTSLQNAYTGGPRVDETTALGPIILKGQADADKLLSIHNSTDAENGYVDENSHAQFLLLDLGATGTTSTLDFLFTGATGNIIESSTSNTGVGDIGLIFRVTGNLGSDDYPFKWQDNAGTDLLTLSGAGDLVTIGSLTPTGRFMVPMGEVSYFSTTGTTITISGTSDGSTNMVVVSPATTLNNDMSFDNGGANNGRLRYTGATTRTFHVAMTVSISPTNNNDQTVIGIAKGGSVIAASKVIQRCGPTTDTQSTALHIMVSLATNEYLEVYIGNLTGANNVTVKSLNLFAMGM